MPRCVYTVVAYGLAGLLAHNSAGRGGNGAVARARASACLLDRVLTLAVEIPDRSHSGATNRVAADGARVLCADCARPT